MPYRLQTDDKRDLENHLADLLAKIPIPELPRLIEDAQVSLLLREFGHKDRVRNYDSDNPYLYEHQLVVTADKYIKDGNPMSAYIRCVQEDNHGHSGFTSQTMRVYCSPRHAAEQEVSDKLRHMIINVATALLDYVPKEKVGAPIDAWQRITSAHECLLYLGAEVPEELISRLAVAITEYEKLDAKSGEFAFIKREFQRRFSSS